ncbi:MAG TPA: CopD family protein, partial [Nitrospiria bacterium]|nr:CopD family protein [Nitrospiria bacterium]
NLPAEQRFEQIRNVGLAARAVGWISLLVLLLTGGLNVVHLRPSWDSLAGQVLLAKISVVGMLVGLTILHDFMLGPRLTAMRRSAGSDDPTVIRLQWTVRWLARTNLLLALSVVFLAVLLARS